MFILEAGKNHFGQLSKANKMLNFFLKSDFKKITYMCQHNLWYKKKLKKGKNFFLPINFYKKAINLSKKKNKKIGLSVCDLNTFKNLKNLNFNFYKLLSIAINNYELIDELKKKNKMVYISTGYNASQIKIEKCIKRFGNYKKKILLHTPMVKRYDQLKFKKILFLKKKFKIDVGYSNHFSDFGVINALSAYDPKVIMLYIKPSKLNKKKYPDDKHALYLHELSNIKKNYEQIVKCHKS